MAAHQLNTVTLEPRQLTRVVEVTHDRIATVEGRDDIE
jgi:hypothetical protein